MLFRSTARRSRRGFGGTLWKTDAFLSAHPFGTVPAAFTADGTGVFESNSILRAVARSGDDPPLYGRNRSEASRIDSFLDANLVFAREAQVYLLALPKGEATLSHYDRMAGAYEFYLSGVEAALGESEFIAGTDLSIADVSFCCDVAQFLREGHYAERVEALGRELVSGQMEAEFPRSHAHLMRMAEQSEFAELYRYLRWYRER